MTLVYYQAIVSIGDGQTRQLSDQETYNIMYEKKERFGMVAYNPGTFQSYLDRYCQRKGIKPLILIDILL